MAKTKFLDYTGLAKLVEKIKNTYVNIGGSTMTGTLKTLENQPAINFRPNNSGYSVTLNYDTESAEALAINLKNPATSFMINSGVDGTTWTGEGHQSKVTPTIQVRKNCVSINKYIADNINPEYKLDVNGDVKANSFTGKLNGNANTASKLGTATVGGATQPIYLSGGTPTACTYTLAQNVTSASKLTDTTYSASTGLSLSKDNKFSINAATSSTIGGVKIGSNITVSDGTISLTKGNVVNALGYTPPTADTNTHYTTGLIVGNSSSSTGNTAVTTNGVFLNLKDDNHIRDSHKIVGGGGTTVTSDSGGTITIDTIYTLSRNVNNHAEISLTSVNGSDDIIINNVENAETAERLSTLTAGGEIQPVYFDGGIPKPLKYTIGKSVPSGAVFTDDSVSQRTYNSHGIPDPYERPLLIGESIIEDGTVNSTIGGTFVSPRITASINSGKITATGGFIGEATSAKKLSVDGGSVGINDVLVLGNYERSENSIGKFTPSGIVSMITDPDIENEIKKPIVWPTA